MVFFATGETRAEAIKRGRKKYPHRVIIGATRSDRLITTKRGTFGSSRKAWSFKTKPRTKKSKTA